MEEINQILHQHIRLVFRGAINYKELIQAFIKRDEKIESKYKQIIIP